MKVLKTILTLLLSIYFALASGGIHLVNHICGCNHQEVQFVDAETHCCSDSNEQPHTDCEAESIYNDNHDDCIGTSCKTVVTELKVEPAILNPALSANTLKFAQLTFIEMDAVKPNLDIVEQTFDYYSNFDDKSPPKAGRLLVIIHQSLKILLSFS